MFVIDCGTGARNLGVALQTGAGKEPLDLTILLSHAHWDHIQGFPFFAPLFVPGNRITVCGPEGTGRSLREVMGGQMEFTYFPVELGNLPATISFRELSEGTHEIGGARVSVQYLHHPAMALAYRIEADGAAIVYMCDHEPFSETLWPEEAAPRSLASIVHDGDRRHAEFMAGAGLLIHDAQYTPEEYPSRRNWGHSTYEYAVALAGLAQVRRVALTHHDPTHDDAFVASIEARAREFALASGFSVEVACAFEGQELTVLGTASGLEATAPAPEAAASVDPRRRHILVVDDDPDIRALASLALTQDGHSVITATGGAEGLEAIEAALPDLVVLDLLMPAPDGMHVLRCLRSRPASATLPVLVLTSMDDELAVRAGFERGADDYLVKPFTMPQLAARVRVCLARADKPAAGPQDRR
jgi:CheY-like chemotaxis protein/phosphoribosyl 1,2-cyclic phosphodiesterase